MAKYATVKDITGGATGYYTSIDPQGIGLLGGMTATWPGVVTRRL